MNTAERPSETPPADLGRVAVRGAGQTTAGQLVRMVLQFGAVIVLARLLSPEDYGLMALGLAVVAIGEVFRDSGLSLAAIRTPDLTDAQRDNLFWLNTALGLALTLLTVATAGLVALAFDQPALIGLLWWLSLVFLLNGLATQYRADLTRRLMFWRLMVIDIVAQLAGVVVAVVLALVGAGVLALVAQTLSSALVVLIACGVSARWWPGRPRRGVGTRGLVRFGLGMLGAQLVGYVSSNVDTVIIGLRMSVVDLGLYNRGYQLLMRPLGQLRGPTTNVAVPVLSKIDKHDPRSASFLVRGQIAMGYTLVPVLALATGAAGPIIAVALGPEWAASAPVFALLAVAGALQTLSFIGYWVYVSRGMSAQLFRYSLVSLAIKIVCVVVGSHWGVTGVAAGIAVSTAIAWPISLAWLSVRTPLPVADLYRGAARILCGAVLAGGAAAAVVMVTAAWPALVQVLLAGLAALAGYAVLMLAVPAIRQDGLVMVRIARRLAHR